MTIKPRKLMALAVAAALAVSGPLVATTTAPIAFAAGEQAQAQEQEPITFTFERTDDLGDTLQVGQRLTFRIRYTNNTDGPLTAFPANSNLSDFDVESAPTHNCRWANLPAHTTKECGFGFHVVTEEDAAAGSFTPTSTWKVTRDRAGEDVVKDGITLHGQAVKVINEAVPDEPQTPKPVVIGEPRVLASAGDAGFACHRIPAITKTPKYGWILATWDGRPGGCADAPQANSILGRISKDGGKSWGPITTLHAGKQSPASEKYGYSDSSLVVDEQTGTIFMFSVLSYDQGFGGSQPGDETTDDNQRQILHAVVSHSTDDGQTWSDPQIITHAVTRDRSWRSRFAASGQGIQLRYGAHAGRLVQQFTIAQKDGPFRAVSVYSDDHGKTWKAGHATDGGADENKVVELSDGRLMLNSRSPQAGGGRLIAYSNNGGERWGQWFRESQLIDPVNNAGFVRAFPDAPKGSARAKILLFSNANSNSGRVNGYVRVSYDDGDTWTDGRQFQVGNMAYSTITPLGDGTYGLLYEGGGYRDIVFKKLDSAWLELQDPGEAETPQRPAPEQPAPEQPVYPVTNGVLPRYAPAPSAAPAKDVGRLDLFSGEIAWLMSQSYANGWPDGTFRPLAPVSRAAMAAFLYRLAGSPVVDVNPQFNDVPADHQFAAAITWMRETGISTGWNDGTFRPEAPIERQAMAAFMHRVCGHLTVCSDRVRTAKGAVSFSDVEGTSPFAADIAWMRAAGISTGYPDGTFHPGEPVSRSAMAAFIYRMVNNR